MRHRIALATGRAILFLSRLLKTGGGSSLPGLIALRIDPKLVTKITGKISGGTIVVTGTNGKTTTSKQLADILQRDGKKLIRNLTGSNLMRGIASTLIEQSTIWGRPKGDVGLFEVDEATMPEAMANLRPSVVLVTNLFRDQLDRYGELDKTADIIAKSLKFLKGGALFLNADDPLVSSLASCAGPKTRVIYYGLGDYPSEHSSVLLSDALNCPTCGAALRFDRVFYGHLGEYACTACAFKRPKLDYAVNDAVSRAIQGSTFSLTAGTKHIAISLALPGLHNIYNSLAACSVAEHLGASDDSIQSAMAHSGAAFGRAESFTVNGKKVYLMLAKNPVGLTQSIEVAATEAKNYMMILNDLAADGTDISWIWDADFRAIDPDFNFIYTSGDRATDMAVRLKYEGFGTDRITSVSDIVSAFNDALLKTPAAETLYVLATYTGMQHLRNHLAKKGLVKSFWEVTS